MKVQGHISSRAGGRLRRTRLTAPAVIAALALTVPTAAADTSRAPGPGGAVAADHATAANRSSHLAE